jgi:hypothetical protein
MRRRRVIVFDVEAGTGEQGVFISNTASENHGSLVTAEY